MGALALALALTAACAAPPLPPSVPRAVSVAEPVSARVADTSVRDLQVNSRCTAVNLIVFALVSEFRTEIGALSDRDAAQVLLVNGTLASFFQDEVFAALSRQGITGAAARRADRALGQAYITAYLGAPTAANSPARRAQSARVMRDLEYCNVRLAGLPG